MFDLLWIIRLGRGGRNGGCTRASDDRRGGVEGAEEVAASLADGLGGLEARGGRGDAVECLEGDALARK